MTFDRLSFVIFAAALAAGVSGARAGASAPAQQIPVSVRVDASQTPVGPSRGPKPTGAVMGTIVAADSGQPVDGARLTLVGERVRGGRTVTSDDDGRFVFAELPGDRYTLSASKPGYVSVVYGQKAPGTGDPGTPIALAEGQQIKDLTVGMPRGGVITGAVYDDKGRPAVGVPVRTLRWTMRTGQRTLTSSRSATTDDRGIYRVYGLTPGDYVVSAQPRNLVVAPSLVFTGSASTVTGEVMIIRSNVGQATAAPTGKPRTGYAPVYYPGTSDVGAASSVEVGVGQQAVGIDIRLQRVPLATVSGRVEVPPGLGMSNMQVRLVNTAVQVPGMGTQTSRTRTGAFTFNNVTPGQYRLVATATRRTGQPPAPQQITINGRTVVRTLAAPTERLWAVTDVAVAGEGISGLILTLQPGMSVSGRLAYDGPLPATAGRRVRLTLSPVQNGVASGAASASATADASGRFTFSGVVPGAYRLRVNAGTPGWVSRSALVGGVDVLDFPLEVRPDTNVTGMVVTLSNRAAGLSGTLQDAMGRPTSQYMVVLFPSDSRYWVPMARRIHAVRPGTDGRFVFGDLPAGNYRLTAVIDAEPGQWYDPAFLRQILGASIPVALSEGETRTQDVRIRNF